MPRHTSIRCPFFNAYWTYECIYEHLANKARRLHKSKGNALHSENSVLSALWSTHVMTSRCDIVAICAQHSAFFLLELRPHCIWSPSKRRASLKSGYRIVRASVIIGRTTKMPREEAKPSCHSVISSSFNYENVAMNRYLWIHLANSRTSSFKYQVWGILEAHTRHP